jgi:hypothetical protein
LASVEPYLQGLLKFSLTVESNRANFPIKRHERRDTGPKDQTMEFTVELCGILHDGDGWYVNDVYRRATVETPDDNPSQRMILSRARAALGISGKMRREHDDFYRLDGSTLALVIHAH